MPHDGDERADSRIDVYRRKLLAVLGAGGVAGLAGCSSGEEDTPSPTAAGTPTDSGTATDTTPTASPTPTSTETPTPESREFGVSFSYPGEVLATTAEVGGSLEGLGGADTAEVYFQYRPVGADEWRSTESMTLEAPGEVSQTLTGLAPRRDYEYRIVAETSDGERETSFPLNFTTEDAATVRSPAEVTPTSAVLTAELHLADASEVEVAFEYKELLAGEWQETAATAPDDDGTVTREVSGLTARRLYTVRTVVTGGSFEATSDTAPFSTPSGADRADDSAYETASAHHPGDGYAEFASWFDNETPVVTVREPTREQLRTAFEVDHQRLVVFETSGTVDLGGETLAITGDECWVAGQTAPSPGITFVEGQLVVDANDCVVQHVRSRIGPGADGSIQGNDSINTADGTRNNVLDHVTASWGTDECLSVGYDTTDTTVTNALVYEGLYDPYGNGSDHNYGTLVGDRADNVTLAGNVWAKCRGRNPRLKTGTRSAVANNVMYFFNEATNMDDDTRAAIVGNVYIPQDVEDTPIEGGSAYLDDNVTEPASTPLTDETNELSSRPRWPGGLEAMPASDVLEHDLRNAGARPADRTANDERIVAEIRDREGDAYLDSPYDYWVPHQDAVGGYPELPENTHSLSIPDSGLRAWLAEWAMAVEESDASPPSG